MAEDPHKKSYWSAEEDEILKAYVEEHGEKNWNVVAEKIGLNRNGKSCRLRWLTHLKPTQKKGPFTKEEEDNIVRLHAEYGNQWSRIAKEITGRNDNEIKNFWHTRVKRRNREGLPIYPPEVQVQAPAAQTGQNTTNSMAANQNLIQPLNWVEQEILFQQNMNMHYRKRSREMEEVNMRCLKRLRELEAANPFMGGYAMNAQSDQLGKNPFIGSTSGHFSGNVSYGSSSRLPSLLSGDFQDESLQQSNSLPALQPNNDFVQYPQTNHVPSNHGVQQPNQVLELDQLLDLSFSMLKSMDLDSLLEDTPVSGLECNNTLVQAPILDQATSSDWRPQQPHPVPELESDNTSLQFPQIPSNRAIQESNVVQELGLDNTFGQAPMIDQAPSSDLRTQQPIPVLEIESLELDGLMLEPLDNFAFLLEDTTVDTNTSEHISVPPYGSTSQPPISENENMRLPSLQSCDYQEESGYRRPQQSNPTTTPEPSNTFVQAPIEDTSVDTKHKRT